MELNLLVADDKGLVNLSSVVQPYEHFTVARNENTGVVRLTPVKVTTTAPKALATDDEDPLRGDGNY